MREQFQVNVFGVMNVVRAVLPHFRANKGGCIVNVSSGAGVFRLPMISLFVDTTSITDFNNGSWDGGLYAVSLTGNAEGHINPLIEREFCQ